jgi:hypothetical protein
MIGKVARGRRIPVMREPLRSAAIFSSHVGLENWYTTRDRYAGLDETFVLQEGIVSAAAVERTKDIRSEFNRLIVEVIVNCVCLEKILSKKRCRSV